MLQLSALPTATSLMPVAHQLAENGENGGHPAPFAAILTQSVNPAENPGIPTRTIPGAATPAMAATDGNGTGKESGKTLPIAATLGLQPAVTPLASLPSVSLADPVSSSSQPAPATADLPLIPGAPKSLLIPAPAASRRAGALHAPTSAPATAQKFAAHPVPAPAAPVLTATPAPAPAQAVPGSGPRPATLASAPAIAAKAIAKAIGQSADAAGLPETPPEPAPDALSVSVPLVIVRAIAPRSAKAVLAHGGEPETSGKDAAASEDAAEPVAPTSTPDALGCLHPAPDAATSLPAIAVYAQPPILPAPVAVSSAGPVPMSPAFEQAGPATPSPELTSPGAVSPPQVPTPGSQESIVLDAAGRSFVLPVQNRSATAADPADKPLPGSVKRDAGISRDLSASPALTAPVTGPVPLISDTGGAVHVAPSSQPAPSTSKPQDFTAIVDRLVAARDLAMSAQAPQIVQTSIAHSEFGAVSLRFETGDQGLSVTLANADPDFARAVQAASPAAMQSDTAAAAPKQDGASQHGATGQGSAMTQGNSQGQPGAQQRGQQAQANTPFQQPASSRQQQGSTPERPRSGIFA